MFIKKRLKKLYREKLRKIKAKFQKKLEGEKNKFNCILTHDIKTPLLAQIQSLELLLREDFGFVNEKQKELISQILTSNYFLYEIVTNTIFLTKYETEKPKLKLENIDLVEQIKDCCLNIQNYTKDKNQNIVVKSNKNKKIKIFADRKLIQKIIFNLLSSSSSLGFENSKIEVTVKENKGSVCVLTKNKSIYMTKEKINSLFEEKKNLCDFNQLGMSLNLNIAKKLIKAHNWDIIALSEKNNSSVFGFVAQKSKL